ncbi:hypothetical protein PDE_03998 [Penicillium oxalicum 114-2]|uniref:Uncharacterized protein n=1 Tax=Penicillium oxalicum (strain 114-2 / CGMCC 5302) TaxID=933388 RepID=S7ZK40_PENO1|nr:hypothetical protein PDE_03998 [Penicillium oxalicum 114-2]
MSQEEVFSQLWGLGPPEPLEDPQGSSLNQDLSSYQQLARSEEFPTWIRYSLLALQSLPEGERHEVIAKAGITSLMPKMSSVDTPANHDSLKSPMIGANDDVTDASPLGELTHDLSPSAVSANVEINLPKPQPVEAFSYPTPQSAVPSPDVGIDTLSPDFSTPNVDPFQLFGVPEPAYSYPTQSNLQYTSQPAARLDSSTLHNATESMDRMNMGLPLVEPGVLNFQATEQYSTTYMGNDHAEDNQRAGPSLSLGALQYSQAPEILAIDHSQSMTILFPDLSPTKLRQVVELGDRLFPRDLAHLESQVNHWQAERLWSFVDFGFSPGSSTKQMIAGICRHIKEKGNPNAENYMRIRLAKVQVNMLYEAICKEEKNRRLNLGPKKFTTHVLNCIERAIRNDGDRRLPVPRKSLVRDAIFRYKQVGKKWSVSQGLGMTLLVGQDSGRIIESGQFNEMQMEALVFHVSTTRPDIIGLCSKLEYAAKYFLTHNQLPTSLTVAGVRKLIGIPNSMSVIVD